MAQAQAPETGPEVTPSDDEKNRPRDLRIVGFPLAGYTPGTSVVFGGLAAMRFRTRSNDDTAPVSSVPVAALYTLRGQWIVGADPSISLDNDVWRVNTQGYVRNWSSDYYGIGAESSAGDIEEYDELAISADIEIQRSVFHRNFYVGALGHFAATRITVLEREGLLAADLPLGVADGRTAGPGFNLTWDSRNLRRFPSQGLYLQLAVEASAVGLGATFDNSRLTLDVRGFHDVGVRYVHVLAARAIVETTNGDVPFYDLPSLGGQQLMRGIPSGRFRDQSLWATQVEYRSPFLWRIGLTSFAALGQVFKRDGTGIDAPVWSAGAGVRFRIDEASGLNIRVDYGISRGEYSGIYLSVSEAF